MSLGPTAFYSRTTLVIIATAGAVRLAIHYLSINPPAQ
jgi:hypothetical protein